MSLIDSPYVVQYLESGKSKRKDVYWFVMELLVASPLDEVLQGEGPMPEMAVIKVLDALIAFGNKSNFPFHPKHQCSYANLRVAICYILSVFRETKACEKSAFMNSLCSTHRGIKLHLTLERLIHEAHVIILLCMQLGLDMCVALKSLHSVGVIHR